MIVTTTTHREMIHWLWLWTLAAIAVSVMQGFLAGQSPRPLSPESPAPPESSGQRSPMPWGGEQEGGIPIPIPNVDQPDWFRYPNPLPERPAQSASLNELMKWHRDGDFDKALPGWLGVRPLPGSETWQQVGVGVALLQLERFEEALTNLELAIQLDPNNAVAEYFMGKVRQAQGRQIPFWYESDQENPFRFASIVRPNAIASSPGVDRRESDQPKMFLPHFVDDAYDRLARHHFRRAVTLSEHCDLNQVIRIAPKGDDFIQLAGERNHAQESITVRDLLESLGELDYVRKARAALGVPNLHQNLEVSGVDENAAAPDLAASKSDVPF